MNQPLLRILLSSVLLTQLPACGFHLRGYDAPMSQNIPTTELIFHNSPEDYAVKNALKKQLDQLSINTQDRVIDNKATNQSNATLPASIEVKNIRLQNYQLRGILTEIRMVLSAEVSYRAIENGQPRTLTNTIQVQRSYQYDQGVVATDNPQAEQIKVWLYDNLAQRIADQYVALSLPKITKVPTATTRQPN
ncbi:hypothetical protein HG534_09360 [Moraxella osloensis]|nr:hypothetical protein [Moraxella osloensis]MBW4016507.1 hypothetical protein [Moraxella osloensis]